MSAQVSRLRLVALGALVAVLLLACVEPGPPVTPGTAAVPAAVRRVQAAVVSQMPLGWEDRVQLLSWEALDWPDTCLGAPTPPPWWDHSPPPACTPVSTPGYRVHLRLEGRDLNLNSNADGTRFILAPYPAAANRASLPLAEQMRLRVAGRLAVPDPAAVQYVATESVTWPNTCLGARRDKRHDWCVAFPVPGSRYVFAYDGRRYEVHTADWSQLGPAEQAMMTGPDLRIVLPDAEHLEPPTLTWEGVLPGSQGDCARLEIDAARYVGSGVCGEHLAVMPLRGDPYGAYDYGRHIEFEMFAAAYAPFELTLPEGGHLVFNGRGTTAANSAQQRGLRDWVSVLWLELRTDLGQDEQYARRAVWRPAGATTDRCNLVLTSYGLYYRMPCDLVLFGAVPHLLTAQQAELVDSARGYYYTHDQRTGPYGTGDLYYRAASETPDAATTERMWALVDELLAQP